MGPDIGMIFHQEVMEIVSYDNTIYNDVIVELCHLYLRNPLPKAVQAYHL